MVTLILTLNIQDKIYLCLQKRKDEEGAMDDSTLIEQIQLGSKDAFKQMFIKFYSPLCEYASQYVSDEGCRRTYSGANVIYMGKPKFLICRDILEILSFYGC